MTGWQATTLVFCAGGGLGLLYHVSTQLEKILNLQGQILQRLAQQRGEAWARDDD